MNDLWYKFLVLKIQLCQTNVWYATFQTLKINSHNSYAAKLLYRYYFIGYVSSQKLFFNDMSNTQISFVQNSISSSLLLVANTRHDDNTNPTNKFG